MLETDPEFDRKLRALYDHIKTQEPPASLARISTRAIRPERKALSRFAGVAAFAVIVAGIALFATELHAHHVTTPPGQGTHTVQPGPVVVPSPVWSPSPLPSPNSRLALPTLPNRSLLPTSYSVLVPVTQGTGLASVTIVPYGELYIQYACVGDTSLVITATGVLGPDRRPPCSSSVNATVYATSLPEYPNQVLKASDLGRPVTIEISTSPSTTWEIFIAESAPPAPALGWVAVAADPSTAGDGEHGDIYFLSAGADPRRVIGSDGDDIAQECPAFSPDGRRLAYGEARAFDATDGDRGVWPVSDRAVVVVGVNADGDVSQPFVRVTLPASPGEIACPEWSPDGRYVAYRVGADLWVADTTTGTTTLFPVLATPWGENAFAWSRDGSRIAVAELAQIRLVPIDGSTPTVIRVVGTVPAAMGWTAGDAGIVYVSRDSTADGLDVNRVDANGTNDIQLAPSFDAVISPDGTRVAYISGQPNDEHIMIMPTGGGQGVAAAVPSNFSLGGFLWSPDGTRLLVSSIDGVVSVDVAPGSAPIVYDTGRFAPPSATIRLNLELTTSDVTWQPSTGPSR
jgi:hypothetical protein